ncbi:MAG TPA: hypothetical protein VFH00_06330 [Candidatus Nitrosotalea sp.]|nr:hypothetical protein [Candidatus Nitrosotalea sp.]
MKLSTPEKVLAVTLVAYIVLDILLTPVARLETRSASDITSLGLATLGLIFVGLALATMSLVLLFRNSPRTPIVAIVAAVLYFPCALADLTGNFSSVRQPAAIEVIELVQVVVALILVGVAVWILRAYAMETTNRRS